MGRPPSKSRRHHSPPTRPPHSSHSPPSRRPKTPQQPSIMRLPKSAQTARKSSPRRRTSFSLTRASHHALMSTTPTVSAAQELLEIASFFSSLIPILNSDRSPFPRSRSEHTELRRATARRVPRSVSFAHELRIRDDAERHHSKKHHSVHHSVHDANDALLSPCTSSDEHEHSKADRTSFDTCTSTHTHSKPESKWLLFNNLIKLYSNAFNRSPH